MNEIVLAVAVFTSSGAGFMLGKHDERIRAKKAFRKFYENARNTMNLVQGVFMDETIKRLPDLDQQEFARAVAKECTVRGLAVGILNTTTGKVEEVHVDKTE